MSSTTEASLTSHESQELRTVLLTYRSQFAKQSGRHPANVLTIKLIETLIEKRPKTIFELIRMKGIGVDRAELIGEDILNILRQYEDSGITGITFEWTPTAPSMPDQPLDLQTELLIAALRAYRYETSKQIERPAFHVFTNQTMSEIAKKRPTTMVELLEINGIGPRKLEEFGEEILEVVRIASSN